MERVDSMKNATRSGGIFSISFISERRLSPSKPEACTQDTTEIGGSGQLQYAEIRRAITPARLTAFDRAAQSRGASHDDAINLYEWNAELASALLLPLHLFEVVLRNAIHEALTRTYRERWPWDNRSLYSVPQKHGRYEPRRDVQQAASRNPTTGKVIPELKFVFWEQMLSSRYDTAIWNPLLTTVFPNVPESEGTSAAVRGLARDVGVVRGIRNRVAHHEPIFSQNIDRVMDAIQRISAYRSHDVGNWVKASHRVTEVQGQCPSWYAGSAAVPGLSPRRGRCCAGTWRR
ncbi:hypothetical protein M707_27095 [Arthrobacter sp. AK-YN10]|nr:hypothetical protein M707_27095 [Arthrobacter sp. AK-YN10]